MKEKECFKCNKIKPLSEYYKHSQMGDGHLNKCKGCTKSDVSDHRNKNIESIREYDRKRGSRQTREYQKEYRAKFPNKYKAHCIVNSAMRTKKLFRQTCEQCGSTDKTHAHHDDYKQPLNVRWLCPVCHKEWHEINGSGKNQ
jgi:hypothetical protein